jgi:hypothetical protein
MGTIICKKFCNTYIRRNIIILNIRYPQKFYNCKQVGEKLNAEKIK